MGSRAKSLLEVILIAALAAAARAWSWSRTEVLFDDGPVFLEIAAAIGRGDWPSALRHPYHPLTSIGIHLLTPLFGNPETAAVALSIAFGTLAVVAFVFFLRDAFDDQTARLGGLLLALHPFAVRFSSDVQSDGIYMGFFVAGAFALWRALRTRSRWWAAGAGALSGFAYLTRPEGLGLALIGGAAAAVLLASRRWRIPAAAGWALALALGVSSVSAPYLVALRAETGYWQISQKKSLAQLTGIGPPPEALRRPMDPRIAPPPSLPRAGQVRPPRQTTGQRLRGAAVDLYRAAISSYRFELLPFLALGLWAARGVPGPRGAFIGGVTGFYALVLAALGFGAGYVSRRHALPPLIPALGYAAFGARVLCDFVTDHLRHPSSIRGKRTASGALAAGLMLMALVPRHVMPLEPDRLAVRRAAEWLRDSNSEPGPVAAGRPRIAYYADAEFVPLPSGPQAGMLHYLRDRGARYVIVDEAKIDKHEGLREARAEGLRLLHRERAGDRSAAVFEVLPPGQRVRQGPP